MTKWQHEVIGLLVKRGMFGGSRKEVAQYLIQKGIEHLVETEYIKKHDEMLKYLRKEK